MALGLAIPSHFFPQTVNKILLKNQVVNDKYGLLPPLYKISLSHLCYYWHLLFHCAIHYIFSPYAIKSAAKSWLEAHSQMF